MDIYLDTETTGLDETAEVIQIGIIDQNGNVLLSSLLKPAFTIPDEAIAIHGITNEDVKNAPCWPEIQPKVAEILSKPDVILNIYNAPYDLRLIKQTQEVWGGPVEMPRPFNSCIMRKFADQYNYGTWVKLVDACEWLEVDTTDLKAHDAVADCEMTRRLHIAMKRNDAKRAKQAIYRERTRQKKLALVPKDTSEYKEYGMGRPSGWKTTSQLKISELEQYEFAGHCCDTYGNKGYLFKPKEN